MHNQNELQSEIECNEVIARLSSLCFPVTWPQNVFERVLKRLHKDSSIEDLHRHAVTRIIALIWKSHKDRTDRILTILSEVPSNSLNSQQSPHQIVLTELARFTRSRLNLSSQTIQLSLTQSLNKLLLCSITSSPNQEEVKIDTNENSEDSGEELDFDFGLPSNKSNESSSRQLTLKKIIESAPFVKEDGDWIDIKPHFIRESTDSDASEESSMPSPKPLLKYLSKLCIRLAELTGLAMCDFYNDVIANNERFQKAKVHWKCINQEITPSVSNLLTIVDNFQFCLSFEDLGDKESWKTLSRSSIFEWIISTFQNAMETRASSIVIGDVALFLAAVVVNCRQFFCGILLIFHHLRCLHFIYNCHHLFLRIGSHLTWKSHPLVRHFPTFDTLLKLCNQSTDCTMSYNDQCLSTLIIVISHLLRYVLARYYH